MTAALQALQDQYEFLTSNLDALAEACQTDGQKNALMTQYNASRVNYFNCVNKEFHDDDPGVKALVAQMKVELAGLTEAVAHVGAIAGVITAITTAVQTGAALAAEV